MKVDISTCMGVVFGFPILVLVYCWNKIKTRPDKPKTPRPPIEETGE